MLAYYNAAAASMLGAQLSPKFSSVRAAFAWGRDEGFLKKNAVLRHTDGRECTLEEVQEWLSWLDYLKYGDDNEEESEI